MQETFKLLQFMPHSGSRTPNPSEMLNIHVKNSFVIDAVGVMSDDAPEVSHDLLSLWLKKHSVLGVLNDKTPSLP